MGIRWRMFGSLVALFIVGFIEVGVVKSFGVLVADMVFQLRSDLGTIGVIVGSYHGVTFLLGPIVTACLPYLSAPWLACIGLIGASCLSMTSLTTSAWHIAVLLGISGISYSFIVFASARGFNNQVPSDRFSILYPIADSGNAIGMMVLPVLAQFLLGVYGWRGTLLLLGGIVFHVVPLIMVLSASGSRGDTAGELLQTGDADEVTSERSHSQTNLSEDSSEHCPQTGQGARSTLTHKSTRSSTHEEQTQENGNDLETQSIEEENSLLPASELLLPEQDSGKTNTHVSSLNVFPSNRNEAWTCFRNSFAISSIVRNPSFLLLYQNRLLGGLVYSAWVVFLIPHGVSKGFPLSRAVFLASYGGFGNIIGRLVQGPIIHKNWVSSVDLITAQNIINAIVFLVDPLLHSYSLLSLCAFMGGFTIGGRITTSSVLIKEFFPGEEFTSAYGLCCFFFGVGEPLGGFLAGWLVDKFSFDKAFMFLGGIEIVNFVLFFPLRYFRNRHIAEY